MLFAVELTRAQTWTKTWHWRNTSLLYIDTANIHNRKLYLQNSSGCFNFNALDVNCIFRAYICQARRFHPYIPKELADYIVTAYANLRKEEGRDGEFSYTTARTLLAILRLSTALVLNISCV
jgi:DNA replicative helicase MCM subunit Mcm2 (Cdc46/Mcm family)